jgi:5-methylcytosine-specific restriction endonuclease McrA
MTKSRARQKLDLSRDLILWLFDNRCLMCGKPSKVIHEIVPISHGKASLRIQNRVIICNEHHTWAQDNTKVSIPILQSKRKKFLIRKFGLENEIGL